MKQHKLEIPDAIRCKIAPNGKCCMQTVNKMRIRNINRLKLKMLVTSKMPHIEFSMLDILENGSIVELVEYRVIIVFGVL